MLLLLHHCNLFKLDHKIGEDNGDSNGLKIKIQFFKIIGSLIFLLGTTRYSLFPLDNSQLSFFWEPKWVSCVRSHTDTRNPLDYYIYDTLAT